MPPQTPPNIGGGQFAQAIGGGDVLRAAMARRGIDTSVLDQVSPAAGGAPSPVAPALPEGVGGVTPEQQVADQAVGGVPAEATPQSAPFRSSEMEISLKALNSVVSTENSIIKQALKFQGI